MRWHYTEQEKPLQSCDCIIKTKKGVMFAFFEEFFYATNDGRGRLIEDVLLQDEDVLAWESIEAVSDSLDTIEFGRMIMDGEIKKFLEDNGDLFKELMSIMIYRFEGRFMTDREFRNFARKKFLFSQKENEKFDPVFSFFDRINEIERQKARKEDE
jgi:hypothetical protein